MTDAIVAEGLVKRFGQTRRWPVAICTTRFCLVGRPVPGPAGQVEGR